MDDKTLREAIRRSVAHAEPKKDLIGRIEELEAKLAKAVKALEDISGNGSAASRNPQLMVDKARATLAELKGQGDE